MLTRFIGFTHLISGVTISSLPLIEHSDRSFDIFMLGYSISPISWMLCKDECIISYIVKKFNNPKYLIGSNPFEYMDITELFEFVNAANMLRATYTTIAILQTASLITVQQLTPHVHPALFYLPMTLKLVYSTGLVSKRMFPYFQGITVTSFSLLLYQYFTPFYISNTDF